MVTAKKITPKTISAIVFGIIILFVILSVLSSRFTPSTNQVRVNGLSTSLAPLVSGYVSKVYVELHSEVKEGDTLFVLNRTPFEIAVKQAEIDLENTTQGLSASIEQLKAAAAQLNRARVQLERATKNWERTKRILAQQEGALSDADRDRSESSYLSAIEGVKTAEANLEGQKAALGPMDDNNPRLKAALNQLEKANWDLSQTILTAPTNGVIESFNVQSGFYAAAGRPMVTLVSNETIWIQANMTEKNLTHLEEGHPADITFDVDAGTTYRGKVSSIAYGVKTQVTTAGDLPTVRDTQSWLREQQRFPVIITLEDKAVLKKLRQGSQGVVVVYTGDNIILNALAKFKIWLSSIFAYVR